MLHPVVHLYGVPKAKPSRKATVKPRHSRTTPQLHNSTRPQSERNANHEHSHFSLLHPPFLIGAIYSKLDRTFLGNSVSLRFNCLTALLSDETRRDETTAQTYFTVDTLFLSPFYSTTLYLSTPLTTPSHPSHHHSLRLSLSHRGVYPRRASPITADRGHHSLHSTPYPRLQTG